uniref:Uncharacterized protein n=1 Tax=Leersia perrieri TaxID=77586 RepID=A0A0D9V7V8_9ORYZ
MVATSMRPRVNRAPCASRKPKHDEPAGVTSPVSRQAPRIIPSAELYVVRAACNGTLTPGVRCPPNTRGFTGRATGRRYDRHRRRQAAAAGASPFSVVIKPLVQQSAF